MSVPLPRSRALWFVLAAAVASVVAQQALAQIPAGIRDQNAAVKAVPKG